MSAAMGVRSLAKSSGTFNNLVIYIRFLNEPAFTISRSAYDASLNSTTGVSMRNYYREVSYNKLDIVSYHLPGDATTNIYYTDSHPRSYYQPYNASTNTNGYSSDSERTTREHSLLANACSWINSNYSLPAGVNFDVNGDGIMDNVCFVIRGISDGWSDLLWPHRWVLYSQNVKMGGLTVYGYTLQLENVSITTFSHEMFHALGAPDLYHYNNSDVPVGTWDIMANGKGHPGAWMKYKYGGWLSALPEIKGSGTYSVRPLSQEAKAGYILKSPYRTDQLFVFEYRKKSGNYETYLPQTGLIITRIDLRYNGNANGSPDEIYVYRLNGAPGIGGDLNSAAFSDLYNRTTFSDITNPKCFLQDGSAGGIKITNIISMGDSISFTVEMDKPVDLKIAPVEDTQMSLSWKYPWDNDFLVSCSSAAESFTPVPGKIYNVGDSIGTTGKIIQNGPAKLIEQTGLISDETYYYTIRTVKSKNPNTYSDPVNVNGRTGIYSVSTFPHKENFDIIASDLPRGWKSSTGKQGWILNTGTPFSAPNSILLNSANGGGGWLYTPGFQLSSLQKYMITFRYKNLTGTIQESLKLMGGISRQDNGLSLLSLFSSTGFSYDDYVICKTVFKPTSAGVSYLGFMAGTTGSGVLIDDFRIEKVPAATTDHTAADEFYPNPTTGKIIVPAKTKTLVSVFSPVGVKVFEKTIESMQEIDLSSLGKGLFMIEFISEGVRSSGRLIIL
jgi:M6 family metalloprotease-like protein